MSIFSSFGIAIITIYIPVYNEIKNKQGENKSNLFTNNLLNVLVIISIAVCLIGLLNTDKIVGIIGYGFDEKTLYMASELTKILIPTILFLCLSQLISGYLQSNNYNVITSFTNVPNNLVVIIAVLFASKIGITGVTYSLLIGYILQVVVQIPYLKKCGYKYKFFLDFRDPFVRKVFKLVVPVLISCLAFQINFLTDKSLASGLDSGSIAALNYANKLIQLVFGIISVSLSIVIYPVLSQIAASNDNEKLKNTVKTIQRLTFLLIIPISIGTMILSNPIVMFLYQRGNFTSQDTIITSNALLFYSIGLIGMAMRDSLNRAFYVIEDTKTPMVGGILFAVINIILNLILIRFMRQNGLALGSSLASLISSTFIFLALNKKIKGIFDRNETLIIIKAILASAVMAIGMITLQSYLNLTNLSNFAIAVFLGCFLYSVSIFLLKVKEVTYITKVLKTFIKKSQDNDILKADN